ncbi:MAG: hypothetical protein C3F08_05155 [Candidatus Methylomirabilota bacterium]|nr:MAG: hypothetical protein C3F08_05155 [candidate division NC10 bacterium]
MRAEDAMSDDTSDSPKTIGPILQAARMAKGLTIEEAAAASKVPLSYARLMEQEQFHLVPDPLYLIRFLTEYAAFLGLDSKQLLVQLREQMNSIRLSEPSPSMPSIGSRIDLRRLLIYLLPAAAVIPLIFIGLSLFSGPSPTPPPVPQSEAPAPQGAVAPILETPTAAPSGLQATAPGPGPATGSTPIQPPVTAPHVQEPQGQPSRYTLRAEAKDTTWLSVSADGAPWKGTLMQPGETAQWSANSRFIVTIGNIRGAVLSLNGKPVALKAESGVVVRNLILPTEGGPPPAGQ